MKVLDFEQHGWLPTCCRSFNADPPPTQGWRTNNNQGLIGNQTETMRSALMAKQTSFRKSIVLTGTIIGNLSMLLFGPSAHARSQMVLYEGKNSVFEGRGGTKVNDHNVDFWTTGEPARRFRVLATITDERGTGPLAGNVVGARSVAEKVKEAGGDAVIISRDVTGSRRFMDAFLSDRNTCSSNCSSRVKPAITRMIVIKYLGS